MNPEKFWAKVQKGDGCWEWLAGRFQNGYGQHLHKRAHRVAWEMTRGPIPIGMLVLHKCDNRICVRPSHLFIGTQLDNMRDMFSKGRENKAKGERHARARLSAEIVSAIRVDERAHEEIAAEYGVSRSTVSLIKERKRWAHV